MDLIFSLRYRLLSDYMDELESMLGNPPLADEDKLRYFESTQKHRHIQWIDIFDKTKQELIGFLLIGTYPNCHPDADYFIQEAYIVPQYRRKQHMFTAFSRFVEENGGSYCLFILNKNEVAKRFWATSFAKLGYSLFHLEDVGAGDITCEQYGYKPNTN